jgi:phosphate transport system substrate-binding protein
VEGIFNGSITRWDSEVITKLNPGMSLYLQDSIRPLHRTSDSGTTFIFTQTLSSFSEEWYTRYGTGLSINWGFQQREPITESAGMITTVSLTPYSIGYVGLDDLTASDAANARGIKVSKMVNSNGTIVEPTLETLTGSFVITYLLFNYFLII